MAVNTALTSLNLDWNQISDVTEIGRGLAVNTALTYLDLRYNQISDVMEIGCALASNTTLEKILLRVNNDIPEDAVEALQAADKRANFDDYY